MSTRAFPNLELASIRQHEFTAASRMAYFDHASDSPVPERAARVISERTTLLQDPSAAVKPREEYFDESRQRLGHMTNANPAQFAFLTNISDATATIANGIAWQPGDEVVLIRGEFASFVYPWRNLEPVGVTVRFVEKGGAVGNDLDRIEAAIGPRTRVVAISHVEYESGYRNGLEALARLTHARDALFVVDASQSLGVLPIDIERNGIDALVSVGYKWLMAPHGISVLYVSERAMVQIRPTMPGRYSVDAGWQTLEYGLSWRPDAWRYQGGALNWIGVCALAESLGLLEMIGPEAVESAAMGTMDRIVEQLKDLPVEIKSDLTPARRSAILAFSLGSNEADEACVASAREKGILVGSRGYGIRTGAHLWNNQRDVETLIAHIQECL
ncbi:aminotransferase class V-fold PLP-dependent enzyme [soil metagenome]